ncbi:bifunctional riboflavin kinase/FAD synthetase [Gammaproteobacteria bacterium]|nr:bifunctional riboflavin kinase/FAD synthetase [Gammaproteobacteria bacterium]
MKIFNSLDDIPDNHGPSSITIGNFDGLHIGHIELLKNTIALAKKNNTIPIVLTFSPMPEEYFQNEYFFRLMDNTEKSEFIKDYGIEEVILIPFNEEFSKMNEKRFIDEVLVKKLNTKHIIVGNDFRFGHKRVGNVKLLESYGHDKGIKVTIVNLIEVSGKKISSTSIRKLLISGKILEANNLLRSPFSIQGEIIHGEKLGRELGYPTANIEIYKSYPINGIFLVEVLRENSDKLYGLASIGNKPTFSGTNDVLEVFIFNFKLDIYGETIKVIFLEKIRDQIKFNTKKELIDQMKNDHNIALNILRKKNEL